MNRSDIMLTRREVVASAATGLTLATVPHLTRPAPPGPMLTLPDRARSMGIHVQAGKGSGKSRLLGRLLAWSDFRRGVPLVIFDPVGATVDNWLDRLTRLPPEEQKRLARRIRYVDMSGTSEGVAGFPLYYRLGDESLFATSQRFLDVLWKSDPALQGAPVQGWNAVWRIGTYTGMALAALQMQITEASSLLADPAPFLPHLSRLTGRHPELADVLAFFSKEYPSWNGGTRASLTGTFLTKITSFALSPTLAAMFGQSRPGITWSEVVDKRLAVLIDFRREHDLAGRRFKMLWAFATLLDWLKWRGAGRHRPLSLIIDELTALLGVQTLEGSVLATELDELINVYARNCALWLTIAHQELFQFDVRTQKTLMTMGTQIFGASADLDAGVALARQYVPYDPYLLKKTEKVWTSNLGMPRVIDHRTVEFTPEEQQITGAQRFLRQGRFRFLVRPAPAEGDTTGPLVPVSLERLDPGQYPNESLVAQARAVLARRTGRSIEDALKNNNNRLEMLSKHVLIDEDDEATIDGYARPHTPPPSPGAEDDPYEPDRSA